MRMSCNGCRVLRKGCSENCSIKPCLDWIASPESQANATVFLAKFYGRAGLLNLLSAAPHHHRPAIFKSLLYEACGRIVNPIYGSVGLLWSGNWQLCQAAVEAVLKGKPITPITSEADACANAPPTKCYDIRHVMREENSAASSHLTRVKPNRTSLFKRTGLVKPKATKAVAPALKPASVAETAKDRVCERRKDGSTSHGSSVSHPDMSWESMESMVCVEMDEVAARAKPEAGEVKLELTLGFEPIATTAHRGEPRRSCTWKARDGVCNMGLELEL